ncbi:uncharacterized protein LOC144546229 [Carex rostrata]
MTNFEGLENVINLEDAQHANLRNKCKLETLDLCWETEFTKLPSSAKSELMLSIISEEGEIDQFDFLAWFDKLEVGRVVGADDVDFSLLEYLQPHPNLKELQIKNYQSPTLPRWMRDPLSLKSIQEISLESCNNLQSLAFSNLHTLKRLEIHECSGLQILQLERLPSRLENLYIDDCGNLELITGLGALDMLATLTIFSCKALKLLKIDELELVEVESTECFGDSSLKRQSISSSLIKLEIEYCDLLCVLPAGLIPSGPICYVRVQCCRCPDIAILRSPTGHMIDEMTIFGRGAELKEIIGLILSEQEYFSVISIVGVGGIGKTTIAQLVYNDLRNGYFFNLFGWVCVYEGFDVKRLIKATIESISNINCGVSELSSLQEELAKIVKGKKILLVLDDVWNENQSLWEFFWVPFKEANMVRVLVTTRNKKVAEVMQATACFTPTNLPEDSCWQLFQHYAFSGTSGSVPPHLVNMGREIVRKCGGLPLAVKSIASLLRHEADEKGWRDILESDIWESNLSGWNINEGSSMSFQSG